VSRPGGRPANKQATTDSHKTVIGYSFIHNAVDDHSRLACSEVLNNERKQTAAAFWQHADAFLRRHGITVERVLADNGSCYRSKLFAQTPTAAGIVNKRTRSYRPQTNGKVERFNRTLFDEWACPPLHQPYPTNRRVGGFSPQLQPSPLPHGTRRHASDQSSKQPCGSIHLDT
jgi:transposase InsO family protein